jgi:hypothetical protein
MGSLNSNVQAELGPARAANASHLLFGRSSFPETARLLAAHVIQSNDCFGASSDTPLRSDIGRVRRFQLGLISG